MTPTPEEEESDRSSGDDSEPDPTPTPEPTATPAPDSDDDGLNNEKEKEIGTDPDDSDTDGDGLTDSQEANGKTDPTDSDTDDDEIDDGRESEKRTSATNPDSDGDGLKDGYEAERKIDATIADSDRDGLNDGDEVEAGTDTRDPDSDGDTYSDGQEVKELTGNPLRMSIYVEVDVDQAASVPDSELRQVKEAFDEAPVESKNGADGIGLHFVVDDTNAVVSHPATTEDLEDMYNENHDLADHHYLLVVSDNEEDRVGGYGVRGIMMVTTEYENTERTIMHELGHSLGLSPNKFDGIDSRKYTFGEYPSVMNYNSQKRPTRLDYSDDDPFDGWEYIEENPYKPV